MLQRTREVEPETAKILVKAEEVCTELKLLKAKASKLVFENRKNIFGKTQEDPGKLLIGLQKRIETQIILPLDVILILT